MARISISPQTASELVHATGKPVNRLGWSAVAVMAMACLAGGWAWAQEASLPDEVRRSNTPAQHLPAINQFAASQVVRLKSDNPTEVASARSSLLKQMEGGATEAFVAVYAGAVGRELPKAASGGVVTKLNTAIVAARLSEKGFATEVRETIRPLVGDAIEPISLWAIRAARPLASGSVGRVDADLAKAVADVAAGRPTGSTTGTAYRTLVGELREVPPGTVEVVRAMQKVLAARVEVYGKQLAEEPRAEAEAVRYLANTFVWNAAGVMQADKVNSATLLLKLLDRLGARLAETQGTQRQLYQELAVGVSRGIQALGTEVKSDALVVAVRAVGPTTPPAELRKAAADAASAFKQVSGYEKVTLD